MKKFILSIACIAGTFAVLQAQVSVTSTSQLIVKSSLTNEWSTALRTRVPSTLTNGIAYTLSKGHDPATLTDVFFVSSAGWLWAQQGGYFGSDMKLKKKCLQIAKCFK